MAIDFTGSNGDPRQPHSLHYLDNRNQYLSAIQSVGSVLQYYNTDKMINLYGFGAMIPPKPQATHCFALNGDIFNPRVNGLEEVKQNYVKTLQNS